jgi:hypothetical protein
MIPRKINKCIFQTLTLNTLEKSIKESQMDMVDYILTMAILCRASLKMEEGKEKVDGLRRTAVITKVILEIMLQMDTENTLILADISTKDNGKIIFQTVKDKHYTLTDLDIMVNF